MDQEAKAVILCQGNAGHRYCLKDAKKLLATGVHPVNPKLPRTEIAAYAMVASTIMNFDEFVKTFRCKNIRWILEGLAGPYMGEKSWGQDDPLT